jgi:hypothetical protein
LITWASAVIAAAEILSILLSRTRTLDGWERAPFFRQKCGPSEPGQQSFVELARVAKQPGLLSTRGPQKFQPAFSNLTCLISANGDATVHRAKA